MDDRRRLVVVKLQRVCSIVAYVEEGGEQVAVDQFNRHSQADWQMIEWTTVGASDAMPDGWSADWLPWTGDNNVLAPDVTTGALLEHQLSGYPQAIVEEWDEEAGEPEPDTYHISCGNGAMCGEQLRAPRNAGPYYRGDPDMCARCVAAIQATV